ncbi:sialidase family protein [Pontibacter arcticus]|uniref:sialidase family protein n=1 Tax=Pontibacter arcticus TaxID=2080288 RepID=UPI001EF0C99F|nr:sialidase family protein [Pontibacter arcticus]
MRTVLQRFILSILAAFCLTVAVADPIAAPTLLAAGRQPQVATDIAGTIRIVYGQSENIYCATSTDNGHTFSEPVLVAHLSGLYLGMSMGPQIASSALYSVVTAIDKGGNIHSYSLQHKTNKWTKAATVNNVTGSAPEGLMSLAADEKDTFYAVWLDVRDTKQNKIVLASASKNAASWSDNKVVYQSPDETVCECCKPSITVQGKQVTLMFRNWIDGSRDFYLTTSKDGGKTFSKAQKLGKGTWQLKGCPMDGGGLTIDQHNKIQTVWQRDGKIYHVTPGATETEIGQGRNCRLSGTKNPVIAWRDNNKMLKVKFLNTGKETTLGKGSYIETVELADKATLCVWENEDKIYFRKL